MMTKIYEEVYSEIFPFWDEISVEEKHILCDNTVAMSYPKGATVHNEEDCSGVYFVRKGCLRVYIMSEEGKEVTLYRLHEGDICMLSASCVLRTVTFDVFMDAEENSECYVISGCAYNEVSENNPKIKIYTLETAVSRFSDVMWVMQQIMFMSMDKRLAIFLWDEMTRIDSELIPLTHEQIAKYMGSAREVVSRMLKYFSNEGIVELSRKGVRVIDKERLRQLIL